MTTSAEPRERLPDGPFETFHANGELASRGRHVGGMLDGTYSRFASSGAGAQPLRPCCVPPGAHELRGEYRAGRLLDETFLDALGRPLTANGTPWPERPPGVPDDAHFHEPSGRYYQRLEHDGLETVRYFDEKGARTEEHDLCNERICAKRRYTPDGLCVEEGELDESMALHGAHVVRFRSGEAPYADARVHEERSRFEHGEPSGTLRLYDAAGAELAAVELGPPLAGGTSPLVTGAEPADSSAPALFELAARLTADGRLREALAVTARGAARAGDAARLRAFLERHAAALKPEVAAARAELPRDSARPSPSRWLSALLAGARPGPAFRLLATGLRPEDPAALDFAEVAVLLEPDLPLARATRGLLRLEQGDREGALADAGAIAESSPPGAEFLREYVRVLFADFGFSPADDAPEASTEELLDVGVAQPLPALRRTVSLYATRILRARTELVRRLGGEPAWLPPDTSALLPGGPVELRQFTAQIQDEDDAGEPTLSEVPVDETLALAGRSARSLLVGARADWAALCWLCWSTGLDRVTLPERVEERPLFAAAANRSTLRCFWAHDRLRTEGLVAASRQIPTFLWHGLPIASMPRHFVDIAAAELLEVRAVFLWLLFETNVSPFQADLRKV